MLKEDTKLTQEKNDQIFLFCFSKYANTAVYYTSINSHLELQSQTGYFLPLGFYLILFFLSFTFSMRF